MSEARKIEEEYLEKVESTISTEINFLLSSMPYSDIHPYDVASDAEDRQDLQYKKAVNSGHYQQIQEWRKFIPSPYFGRLDLSTVKSISTNYIGYRAIIHRSNILVSDWRSRIGDIYRDGLNFFHIINAVEHDVELKRSINISKAKLIDFHDTYRRDESISKEISDSYLLSILEMNRMTHKISDIVKTIQADQNEIMSSPVNENIVVQGCAGSGKTMVMIHRLSYLLFNNKQVVPKSIRILTPSRIFNKYIWQLSEILEFSEVSCNSVGDYYLHLITEYDHDYTRPTASKYSKIPTSDFSKYVFSDAFKDDFKKSIDKTVSEIMSYFQDKDVALALATLKMAPPDFDITIYNRIKSYSRAIAKANKYVIECRKTESRLRSEIDGARSEISKLEYEYDKKKQESQRTNSISNILSRMRLSSPSPNNRDELMTINNRIEVLKRTVSMKLSELESSPRIDLKDSILYKLNSAAEREADLSLQHLFCSTAKAIYSRYGLTPRYSGVSLSRPELYAILTFLKSIFGNCIIADSFLMVDEGQDISLSEYKLWLSCYKVAPRINVYGDINQRIVKEHEGIADWSCLRKEIGAKYRELYYNYRNTQQIVLFCQRTLNVSMRPVGLTGDSVVVYKESEISSKLNAVTVSGERVAVIYRSKALHEHFIESCRKSDMYIVGDIKKGKISVLSVLEAKGLEFDIVFVLTAGMSKNELYISYTRALDKIYVFNRPET